MFFKNINWDPKLVILWCGICQLYHQNTIEALILPRYGMCVWHRWKWTRKMYVEFRGKTWSKCKPYREHGRQQRKNKTFLRLRELTCYHMSPKKQHQKGVIQKNYGGGGIEKVAEMMDLSSSKRWTIVQEVIQAVAQVRTLERCFKLTQNDGFVLIK